MEIKSYILVKKSTDKQIIYIDYNQLNGFKIKPQNKVEYDGIVVNRMIVIKPSYIDKLLKKKIKRRLDKYLQYIINIIEDSEDSDESNFKIALDDIARYKSIIINNYHRFLDEKYYNLLLKKVALLEKELKDKIVKVRIKNTKKEQKEEKGRKSR